MKKIVKILSMLMIIITIFTACSSTSKEPNPNDLRVTFVTTQGEVNFYLYPDAAPLAVANFINLTKRGFYKNMQFHRAIQHYIIQGGAPNGDPNGGPGYSIPDEIVDWLNFYQPGMFAMANAGPNTTGSQFFFTLSPADQLNNKYTILGEVVNDRDLEIINKLEVKDIIKDIKFRGKISQFLSKYKPQIEQWNKILDEKYPNLKTYQIN